MKRPDLVTRQLTASQPNTLYAADLTYIPTGAAPLYLAVVMDVFSRRIVGWAMAMDMKTRVVLDALEMALTQRLPEGVIHHSDSKTTRCPVHLHRLRGTLPEGRRSAFDGVCWGRGIDPL